MTLEQPIGKEYRNYFCFLCERDVGFAYLGVNIPATSAVMICLNCFSGGENPMRGMVKELRSDWNYRGGIIINNVSKSTPEDFLLGLLEKMIYQKKIEVIINSEQKGIVLRTKTQDIIPYPNGVVKRPRNIWTK